MKQLESQLAQGYSQLASGFGPGAIEALTGEKVALLIDYLLLLNSWTDKVDLVAPASLPQLLDRHLIDSLAAYLQLMFHVKHPEGGILDVGSGGGLPGVVLAIMQPERNVVLCEPRGKRCDFLREIRRRLKLQFTVEECRIEQLELSDLRRPSLAVTRALGLDELFVREVSRLLVPGGCACVMAGPSHQGGESLDVGERASFVGYVDYSIPPGHTARRIAVWSR